MSMVKVLYKIKKVDKNTVPICCCLCCFDSNNCLLHLGVAQKTKKRSWLHVSCCCSTDTLNYWNICFELKSTFNSRALSTRSSAVRAKHSSFQYRDS